MLRYLIPLVVLGATALVHGPLAQGATPLARTLCVFDPAGASGDIYALVKDYRAVALSSGVDFKLKAYTDERTAAEDFKAGQCHAVFVTGTRARPLHPFGGSLEAIGGLTNYEQVRKTVMLLSKKKAAPLMKSGEFEVSGILPGGAVYLFVDDRSVDTVAELAGKRIATLAYDTASRFMVSKVGASLVAADVGTFAGLFNNGSVNACYAPATAYQALELYKGLGEKGGIIRYPLAQLSLIMLIRTADFPEGYGQKTREYLASQFDSALRFAQMAEASVKSTYWVDIPADDKTRYDSMFVDVRVHLRDKEKTYHPKALKLMRKIRCSQDKTRAECAQKRE